MVTVTACGTGQEAGTRPGQTTATGGANGGTGDIAVRDAQFAWQPPVDGDVVYATGSEAPLQLTIVNTGDTPDRLVSIESPAATGARTAGTEPIEGGAALVSGYREVAPATALPQTTAADLALTGLRESLRAGLTYPVTFTFEDAGSVRLQVPIENPDAGPPRAQ
ncbi:copper chaperone PCu(A)C [Pseudonocardia sp. RS010]|uniref:copper chaperone PCu(A)C n=1 Tax=Pseudonocardia sp. RS010 TaxID=3385979 RepID=UPI0039A23EE7